MKDSKAFKQGFSLIETMVAIVVFMSLLVGAVAVYFQVGRGVAHQRFKREAIIQANDQLEENWAKPYSDILDLAGGSDSFEVEIMGRKAQGTINFTDERTDARGTDYVEISVRLILMDADESVQLKGRRYALGLSGATL